MSQAIRTDADTADSVESPPTPRTSPRGFDIASPNLATGNSDMSESVSLRPSAEAGRAAGYSEFTDGDVHWRIAADHVAAVRGSNLNWQHLSPACGAVLVKQNTQRDVWRIAVAGRDYFVKVYHPRGLLHRAKLVWRGPTAVEEWNVGRYAAAFGVGSVVPVACAWTGSLRSAGLSILITEAVPNARPLSDYWNDVKHDRHLADTLMDSLARLIARAHQCGYRHGDMHPGNILVRSGRTGATIHFVDLHKVQTGSSVSLAGVVRNLAQLNQWFRRNASRAWRLRFLVRYLAYRDQFAQSSAYARNWRIDPRRLSADLARQADKHAQALWSKRDRRTLRDSRYFARIKPAPGWRGNVLLTSKHPAPAAAASTLTYARSQWKEWLRDPLTWVDPTRHTMLKDSHTATICKAELPVPGGATVIVKRSLPRNLWKRLVQMFGPSRNRRAWRMANMLLNRDLPAAQPMAVVERYAARWVRLDSILMTDYIPGSDDMEAYLARRIGALPPCRRRAAKDRLISAVLILLRAFDERGFAHRDLKAGNLLVTCDDPAIDPPKLTLIDMEGIRRVARPRAENLRRAVVRLSVSLAASDQCTRTDRLRFLQRLLAGYGPAAPRWKDAWREIDALSQSKRQRHEARRQWKMRNYGRP